MNSFTQNTPRGTFLLRPLTLVALAGISLFATSPVAAADTGAAPAKSLHQMKHETVDQRIADLHKSLKITADEETNWAAVAQVMRDNDAALKVLAAARTAEKGDKISAVDDLKMYEKFAQAHVDGLKALISSFETLYNAMPDQQKLVADGVFQAAAHKS
jgi:acyl-coenzyme A synthetase/AMP-(fatty) acid ligase